MFHSFPPCHGQQFHPRSDVHLLRALRFGTPNIKVLVVEEVPDYSAAGETFFLIEACTLIFLAAFFKTTFELLLQIQFTTALILGINGIRSGCEFPLWMQYMLVIYMISFIVLFGNFYAQAYIAKEKVSPKSKQS